MFLHHVASGTVWAGDAVANLGQGAPATGPEAALLARVGMWQRPGPVLPWKLAAQGDEGVADAVHDALQWPTRTLVPRCGPPVAERARDALADAFAFLR